MKDLMINVMEAPYFAQAKDGVNDREAIQKAIDDAHSQGGGTVYLEAGKTFWVTNLVIRSNVTLLFGDNTFLRQIETTEGYVKPVEGGYEEYTPYLGHNYDAEIKWSHVWYKNYPFIYAPEGSHHFAVKGKGTIRMSEFEKPDKLVKLCPIGFYRAHDFEISDVNICNYHGYAMMPFTSNNGLFKNLNIYESNHGNGDGICLMNCQNIRVTGCRMNTGDDSVYIFSSYRDPRGGGERGSEWWNSEEPQASLNIEIDHNDLESHYCKAFGMILWGIDCPDLEKTEVRNVYVHDNHFKTMGNWTWNPYTTNPDPLPVTNMRFENNVIDSIENNFFDTVISDMNLFHSMREMHNGNFEHGKVFWNMKENSNPESVYVERGEINRGCIDHLDEGDAAIYQGLYLEADRPYIFQATVHSSGDTCRMFVRDLDSDKLAASYDFSNTEPENVQFKFKVNKSGNYHIGIEKGKAEKGFAKITDARICGNNESACGYKDIMIDPNNKINYVY